MGRTGLTAVLCVGAIAWMTVEVSLGGDPHAPRLIPLGTGRTAFGVADDTAVGDPLLVGRADFGSSLGRVWQVDETVNVRENLLDALPGGSFSVALGISRGSRYVAGYADSVGSAPFEAVVWRTGSWDIPLAVGTLPGDSGSAANDVSDAGIAVGTSGGSRPFVWSLDGGIVPLPTPAEAFGTGRAEWISGDSKSIAGSLTGAQGNSRAAIWRGPDRHANWLEDPFQIESLAIGGSENGRNFAGDLFDGTAFLAVAWLDGRLTFLEDQQGSALRGQARGVLNDRTVFGTAEIGGQQAAFLWNPAWGMSARTLESYFLESGGSSVPEPLTGVADLVPGGSDLILAVSSVDGDFFMRIPAIATTSWEVGAVRWEGPHRLSWEDQGTTATYALLDGDLAEVRSGMGSLAAANCRATDLATPVFLDVEREALLPGEGIWFLVRSSRAGSVGQWGGDYSGTQRTDALACP